MEWRMGWMYSIVRHTEDELVPNDETPADCVISRVMKRYYALTFPTSVECDISDADNAEQYEKLCDEKDAVAESFTEENGLEAFSAEANIEYAATELYARYLDGKYTVSGPVSFRSRSFRYGGARQRNYRLLPRR